ncbi:protein of unknown function [Sphingomonas guangdongensis]|uniref:DUF4261 domain-containing protein n=1 Tax=Sphingomonas guangdongensis TaxID=1141890 RepID=A0A285QG96_9SPHN|nr:DUF4261 domain-containing protein [Sphingomonas guangdongensis]SOB80504.1 protein of unknown function [Sphingomonas guangdongensis]
MAIITFSKQVPFPIGALRDALGKHVPLHRWHCGEDDDGSPGQIGRYAASGLIQGRSDGSLILTEYRARREQHPDAPPHGWYLELLPPTTELRPVAERITTVICAAAMSADEDGALCQLIPGTAWLPVAALPAILRALANEASLADAVACAGPGVQAATRAATAPTVDARQPDAHRRGMPMLMLLADRPLQPDWAIIEQVAQAIDPAGHWSLTGAGLAGRGTQVIVKQTSEPAPDFVWESCIRYGSWGDGDGARLRAHRTTAMIGSMLDPAAVPFETVRQVAKVITVVAGLLARLPGTIALINTTTRGLFAATALHDMLGIVVTADELPLALWTRTEVISDRDGDVSFATVGLTPLIGLEVEMWHAPLPFGEAADQMSNVLRYLLTHGQVIGDGDTMGKTADDRAIRCTLEPARAPGRAGRALSLTFVRNDGGAAASPIAGDLRPGADGQGLALPARMEADRPTGIAAPTAPTRARPSAPAAPPRAPAPVAAPPLAAGRRAGGFGRKGL